MVEIIYNNYTYISYDVNGNPTTYLGKTLVWEKGRQLKSYGSYTYKYNNEGIRISKTISGVEHKYVLDGTNIVKETWGSNTLIPLYDLDGTVCGIKYNGTAYYFYKNLQDDIIAITNSAGTVVARYTYDAWGKFTITSDTSSVSIATINPFRYRGYYYDTESGMYYLQSRYYDPAVGRFINADNVDVLFGVSKIIDFNLYAYCSNDCINEKDASGNLLAEKIAEVILSVVASFFMQFFSDFANYLFQRYLYGKTEDFQPDPKDYIVEAVKAALECINPFAKKKTAKLIYNIICPAIFVIVDYVWDFVRGKSIDFNKFGYDILCSMINGLIDLAMDAKARKKMRKLKKKYRKKNLAYKQHKMKIKAEFKALGKKIKLEFEIAKKIIDFFNEYFEQ